MNPDQWKSYKAASVTREDIPWEGNWIHFEASNTWIGEVTITPVLAATLLTFNTHNRPMKRKQVTTLTRLMEEGLWLDYNGETFILAHLGRGKWILIEGQKRLQAVVDSGVTIKVFLVLASKYEEIVRTTGTGDRRTSGDLFKMYEEKDADLLSAACTWQWRSEHDLMASSQVPHPDETRDVLVRNPGLRDSIPQARRLYNQTGLAPSVCTWAIYHTMSSRPDDAQWFWDRLEDNTDPRNTEERKWMEEGDHPIHVGLDKLAELQRSRQRSTTSVSRKMLAAIILAYNCYLDGETTTKYRLNWTPGGKNAKPFPQFHNFEDEEASED